MKKIRYILTSAVFCLIVAVVSVIFVVTPDAEISISERRPLMSFDKVLNPDADSSGKTPHSFDVLESYFLDQFPFRDDFRKLKAFVYTDLFRRNDNNGIYKYNGTVVELQDKLDEKQVNHALNVFDKVRKEYFENNKVYFSIIPDKHYYASKENGYPSMDYEKLFSAVKEGFADAEYVDITGLLSLSDYYKTDSHWSQDKITDVAEKLIVSMNPEAPVDFSDANLSVKKPFYGVYYGQSALTLAPDEIRYLENEVTDSMIVKILKPVLSEKTFEWSVGEIKTCPVYVEEKFEGNDPYDIFLAGPEELIVIENPCADNDKTLVVFRDSFGSSIGPLLAQGYSKTVLVDLRYAVPDMIGGCVEFDEKSDVLFLYSTGMYNNGASIRSFSKLSPVKPTVKPETSVETDNGEDVAEDEAEEPDVPVNGSETAPEETPSDNTSKEENVTVKPEEEKETVPENEPSQNVEAETKPVPEKQPEAVKQVEELSGGLMMYDGYVFEKNEYNKSNTDYAIGLINKICERYLDGNNVYVSVVPDKNYQVMKKTGGDLSGYTFLVSSVRNGIPSARYIDIMDSISLDAYYKTDAHWKQESIVGTAGKIASSMNSPIPSGGYETSAPYEFSGTYLKSGKAEVPKEELRHVSNSTISSMTAKALGMSGSFTDIQMYSAAKMSGAEEYDYFLGGAQTVVTIENPAASNDKELVIFRDSFGSSIAPLIAQGYKKTTLVDLRYVVPDMLPNFVSFENSDVLFLYSANIFNNGRILKNFMK